MGTDNNQREQLIQGLRSLADFIRRHPELPIPLITEFRHCVGANDDEAGEAEMRRIAELLGVDTTVEDGSVNAERDFGCLRYTAFYVSRARMAAHDAEQRHVEEWRAAGKPSVQTCPGQPVDERAGGAYEQPDETEPAEPDADDEQVIIVPGPVQPHPPATGYDTCLPCGQTIMRIDGRWLHMATRAVQCGAGTASAEPSAGAR